MNFKKIVSVVGSLAMIGSTIAFAGAASFPAPFVQFNNQSVISNDFAVVYGTNAAVSDSVVSNSIGNLLKQEYDKNLPKSRYNVTGDFSNSLGITEDKITLGGNIVSGKILSNLTDNKISSLLDTYINWDDGTGSVDYKIYEQIELGDLNIITSLNDNDLENVAIRNDKAISYKLVFDKDLNTTLIGTDDADTLYLNILGKEYEISSMTDNSITVVTSEEKIVNEGESIVVDGINLKLENVFSDNKVQVNGVIIRENSRKKVDGIDVYVEEVALRESGVSKAILKVGKDIEKTFNDGNEYIKDDESWVWIINYPGEKGGYIGVRYNLRELDSDDNIIYPDEQYILPENYATMNFDGLTNVSYNDFELSFDDSKDLYNNTGIWRYDKEVLSIKGPNRDSIVTNTGKETNRIYLYLNDSNDLEVYYDDVNKDVSSSIRPRFDLSVKNGTIGKLVNDETEVNLIINGSSLLLDNGVSITEIKIGGNNALEWFGTTKDAEGSDIIIDNKEIGTEDNDVLDYYGMIIQTPEKNSDNDRVIIGVPSEQVFAKVSVLGQGSTITSTEEKGVLQLGGLIVKDSEAPTIQTKNMIVVGGSCINNEAARLLGVPINTCGDAFTANTGIGTGQYLIQSFDNGNGKIAVLVAGYEAQDTERAVTKLKKGDLDLTIGKRYVLNE